MTQLKSTPECVSQYRNGCYLPAFQDSMLCTERVLHLIQCKEAMYTCSVLWDSFCLPAINMAWTQGFLGCLEVPCVGWRRRRNWSILCLHWVPRLGGWRGDFGAGNVWMHIICIPSVNSVCCTWASVLVLTNRRVGVGVLPISCSPDFATTSNCSGKVQEKKNKTNLLFSSGS